RSHRNLPHWLDRACRVDEPHNLAFGYLRHPPLGHVPLLPILHRRLIPCDSPPDEDCNHDQNNKERTHRVSRTGFRIRSVRQGNRTAENVGNLGGDEVRWLTRLQSDFLGLVSLSSISRTGCRSWTPWSSRGKSLRAALARHGIQCHCNYQACAGPVSESNSARHFTHVTCPAHGKIRFTKLAY